MNKQVVKRTVLSAGAWTIGGFVLSQILRFGGNLLLTRLLMPEYFGIMGIVTVVIVGLTMFSDLGLLQSVVQSRKGETSEYLNTAWTIQIIRGVVLGLLMILIAAGIQLGIDQDVLRNEMVYGNPLLPSVLLVLSIVPVLNGFESSKLFLANRKLDLKPITIIEVSSQFIGLCLMVLLALYSPTIWSLVSGVIVSAMLKTIFSHIFLKGEKNVFLLERQSVKDIISYGKWVLLGSISGFLLSQGDRLLLGGLIDAKSLGVYTIAYFLASAVLLGFARLNRTVFFPALSEVAREQNSRLKEYYYRIRAKTDILIFLVAGTLFMTGQSIIDLLYDERYTDAGWMLEILAVSVLGVASVVAEQIFLATGNSKWMSLTSIAQLLFLYVGVPTAHLLWGLHGAVWVIALAFVPKYLISLFFLKRLEVFSLVKEVRFFPLIIIGLGIGFIVNRLLMMML